MGYIMGCACFKGNIAYLFYYLFFNIIMSRGLVEKTQTQHKILISKSFQHLIIIITLSLDIIYCYYFS